MTRRTKRIAAPILALAALLAARHPARAQAEQQELVDRATLTVQDLFRRMMQNRRQLRSLPPTDP